MVQFTATIMQFAQQGEKTGWMYIPVPEKMAQQLQPGVRKSFRVKGKLDAFAIGGVALIPMGGGDFIIAFNAAMRKGTGKRKGATIKVQLSVDNKAYQLNKEFMECLADEPTGLSYFQTLPKSHQHYFSKWVESAKTDPTRTKRIAMAVSALAKKMGFQEMMRAHKKDRQDFADS
ncbi:MAG TPA: YdeI/OmpD-associated family protein [Chitinophagaceae bacterium]|nr:YdeI/OmpD-associated family protein [Chitinophagaceae bacterium]